jgi:hypothetical protein
VGTGFTTDPPLNARTLLVANDPSIEKGHLGAILIRTVVEVVLRFKKPNMGGRDRSKLADRIEWYVMKA